MPRAVPGPYAIAGHMHPAARLTRPRRASSLRLPCFFFTSTLRDLPAFGPFTGMADVEPAPGDRVYVAAGSRVVAAH